MWSGETVSLVGDQFAALAFPLTAVLILHVTAAQMGLLQALANVPFLILGLLAGVWADRYRRRRLMILSDVSRAVLALSVPVAFLLGLLSLDLLYVVTFAIGTFTVVFDISYQAYLPSLVGREQLTEANGKLQASAAAAGVVGPSLAGGLVQIVGAPLALLFNPFSFMWSASFLSSIKRREESKPQSSRRPIIEEIKEGLSVVLHERRLWSIAGCTATFNLFSGAVFAVLLLYAVNVLKMSPLLIGVMLALGSAGSLLGGLTAGRLAIHLRVGALIVSSAAFCSLGSLIFILAAPPYGSYFLILAFFVTSFGAVLYNVNQISYRQALVPLRLQGRLNATMRFVVSGILPIGSLLGGLLGQTLGLYPALVIGALGGSLAFLWVFFSPVRRVKSIPTAAEVGD